MLQEFQNRPAHPFPYHRMRAHLNPHPKLNDSNTSVSMVLQQTSSVFLPFFDLFRILSKIMHQAESGYDLAFQQVPELASDLIKSVRHLPIHRLLRSWPELDQHKQQDPIQSYAEY